MTRATVILTKDIFQDHNRLADKAAPNLTGVRESHIGTMGLFIAWIGLQEIAVPIMKPLRDWQVETGQLHHLNSSQLPLPCQAQRVRPLTMQSGKGQDQRPRAQGLESWVSSLQALHHIQRNICVLGIQRLQQC